MTTYWLFSVTEENWWVSRRKGVFGVRDTWKYKPVYELVKPGDALVLYVIRRGARRFGGKFVGIYHTVSEWYREDRLLWPDEVREARLIYPWRIRIKAVKEGIADYRELLDKLSFVADKKRPQIYLIGTPANGGKPVPERDAKTIARFLKPMKFTKWELVYSPFRWFSDIRIQAISL
ncbi:MAG: EVE domain-containing protein [Thermoprotei archaeon]